MADQTISFKFSGATSGLVAEVRRLQEEVTYSRRSPEYR
jgi:hypothetical protein